MRVGGIEDLLRCPRTGQRMGRVGDAYVSEADPTVVFQLQPGRFDVVICTGVLHHTADPRGGLAGLVPFVKPGGYVLVGLYNRYARLKTRVRRRLVGLVGERVASLDPYINS